MFYEQTDYDIRLEWGIPAITHVAPLVDAVIIVDVFSFTTCVDVATARGASVYPYRYRDASAEEYALKLGAELARSRSLADCKYSLSPKSLENLSAGMRLVLPSPNGSTLALAIGDKPTFAACLRNAAAVAKYVQTIARSILVVCAGERWSDHTLRPAAEDLIGGGAVVTNLSRTKSPEARLAQIAFENVRHDLPNFLSQTASGRELREQGFDHDISCAADLNCSRCVPRLRHGAFTNAIQ